MMRLYRFTSGGVEPIDVAYVVPGLLQHPGVHVVTPEGKLVGGSARPLPVLPLRPLDREFFDIVSSLDDINVPFTGNDDDEDWII